MEDKKVLKACIWMKMCLWPCFFWSPMAVHIGQKWQTGTDMRRIFGLNIEAKQNFNTSKEAKHVRHSEWVQEVNKSCLNVFQSPLTFYSISCLSLYFPPLQTFLSSTFIVLLADWRLQQSDPKSIPQSIVCLSNWSPEAVEPPPTPIPSQ